MRLVQPLFPLIFAVFCTVTSSFAQEAVDSVRAEELFVHRILLTFREKCFVCHGDDASDIRGEFRMLTREGLLAGGESGEPAVIPGAPEHSPLVLAIRRETNAMPPKENDRLSPQQISDIAEWISGGAPWPAEERIAELLRTTSARWNLTEGVSVKTSGGLSPDWTQRKYNSADLWAYQPLSSVDEPPADEAGANLVDRWIDDHLREISLVPAPPADRRTWIRRATFDLTGLPPTPREIHDFINDPADDDAAVNAVIERLLASPHYGEQWGRHWLDVVRYADSSGYANDYERGNTWRYRDYVVRAFNDDKPYDQFIREQIAGDEIDGTDPEMLVAAGFLRMGPWELTGMEVARVARQRFLDDVTDAVGQVFLGQLLQCARCHDHKFDPIPTRDYYAIQAVFATTQLAERPAEFLPQENITGFEERRYLDLRAEFYEKTLRQLDDRISIEAAQAWLMENDVDARPFNEVLEELSSRREGSAKPVTVAQVRAEMARRRIDPALIPPRHVGFEPRDFGMERVGRKGLERLKWRQERYQPVAFSVYNGRTPDLKSVSAPQRMPENPLADGTLEQTCILAGGDPFSPTDPVVPGVLSVASAEGTSLVLPTGPDGQSALEGRRTLLADWIASPANPLTARVMVNRIWQWHFGQGIARNPNNFGATGGKPAHPELLDELARHFIDNGWSIRAMHRLIMTSNAYRRASVHPHPHLVAERDPPGTSGAVFRIRRLEAEELRDAMLAASGELNRTVGGIPVRPEMNPEAALQPRMVMGTFAEAWQPSALPEQRHRRSLYALRIRGQRDPFMEVFNAPPSEVSCEARETSTVTPQVFAMFNSAITYDRALALAYRVVCDVSARDAKSRPGPAAPCELTPRHMTRLFRLCLGRPPSAGESQACRTHWESMCARHRQLHFDPPVYPLEVVREAVEENTGEKFTFTEPLEVYADFVPDLKPHAASPELRALAEVCLVILNSSEFAYVE